MGHIMNHFKQMKYVIYILGPRGQMYHQNFGNMPQSWTNLQNSKFAFNQNSDKPGYAVFLSNSFIILIEIYQHLPSLLSSYKIMKCCLLSLSPLICSSQEENIIPNLHEWMIVCHLPGWLRCEVKILSGLFHLEIW